MFDSFAKKTEPYMFFIFRVIFGVVFFLHGAQKMGWTGGNMAAGFMAFIGVCELLIGAGIALGLFSRLAAAGGVVIMMGALITVHWPKGIMPLGNGEAAVLNLAAFLLIFALGAGKWSLNHLFFKKEML
jgi:putative oxidoreductase